MKELVPYVVAGAAFGIGAALGFVIFIEGSESLVITRVKKPE